MLIIPMCSLSLLLCWRWGSAPIKLSFLQSELVSARLLSWLSWWPINSAFFMSIISDTLFSPRSIYLPPRPETVRQQHHLYLVSSASWTSGLILSGSLNLIQFKAVIDNPRLLGEPQAHFISSHLCFHVKQGQGPWELLGMFQRLPQSQKGASHSNIHLLENWKDKISTFLKLY